MRAWLAHQGGWDEMIVLLAPVALFGVIRLLEARRRPRPAADPHPPPEDPAAIGLDADWPS